MIFYALASAGPRGRRGFQHLLRGLADVSVSVYRSKTLEKLLQKVLFTCTYNGAEKHVTCERFENADSRIKTNVIATVHFTDDGVSFYDGPGMLIRKTVMPCINSTWIALLIHGFVPVKTWLLIACDTIFMQQLVS